MDFQDFNVYNSTVSVRWSETFLNAMPVWKYT